MEEATTDSTEEIGDRIVEIHDHLQMLQRQLRDGIRRFEALRRRHNPLLHDLDQAHARMNVARPDVARPDVARLSAARANAVVRNVKRNSRVSAEAFGAAGLRCHDRSRDPDDASAEASPRPDDCSKLKPWAVALALEGG